MTNTTKTQIEESNRATQLHRRLQGVVENAKRNFFIMGAILDEIKEREYWKTMGYESFRSYIADPEIGIKQSSAYHAIKLVKTFTLEETQGVHYSKLIAIVPHINEDNREELLEKAQTLSRSDLRKELKLLESGEEEEDVKKKWTMTDVITLIDEKRKKSFRSEIYQKGWDEALQEIKEEIVNRNK